MVGTLEARSSPVSIYQGFGPASQVGDGCFSDGASDHASVTHKSDSYRRFRLSARLLSFFMYL